MPGKHNLLFKIGLVSSALGFLVFLNPLHNEPLWAEWLLGPILIYVGLPLAMVGAAVYFVGSARHSGAAPKPPA
jgi:hypothetical protein